MISWSVPAGLDGGTVTGYTATASPGNETCSTSGATACTIRGLADCTGYSVTVGVQVTGSGTAAPAGVVTVSDGTRSCQAVLSGAGGLATGSCAITEQVPGSYSFTASFPGDANYPAGTSRPEPVTVTRAATTTKLSLSSTSVTYGQEQALVFSVTVALQYSGTPGGQVLITSGQAQASTSFLGSSASKTLTVKA